MADYDAFPTEADVGAYIDSLGLIDEADLAETLQKLRLDVKAAAAKAAFERDTGYKPFLRDTADVTRYFEPNGSAVLDLGGGLLTATSITIGYSPTSPGTALTVNTEYWLEPANAVAEGRPYTRARFGWRQWGLPRSIAIAGRWGYATLVPEDAWNACLAKAAILAYPELSLSVSGGLAGVRTQSTDIRYSGGSLGVLEKERLAWEDVYATAVRSYHRVEI